MTLGSETRQIDARATPDHAAGCCAVAIDQTSSDVFRDADLASKLFGLRELGNIDTSIMIPIQAVFEQRLADLECDFSVLRGC